MQNIQKFSSGYIKTILFAIEYKPKLQFPQTFFIVPHFIHHAQIMGLLLDSSSDKLFDYIVTITHYTLIEAMLPTILKQIFISILFGAQLLLFCYLILATKYTMQVINNLKLRLILERKIEIVNSILHWYFTFYSVFTMPIITISFYYILDPQTIFQVFSYFIVFLQYFQGIILIYLLRNHRFAENNSFKRRFAIIQMLNYSLSYGIIFFKYTVDLKILKYLIGISYAIIQIIDQFYSCPYRDPFREPSLKAALILLTTVIISFIFYQQEIRDQSQFYWTLFAAGLMSGLADSASSQFHEFAMSNYNSKFNLQEKYIIIGVDQFYFHFQRYQENDQTKIVYYQQLIKHRENCTRSKCPTQSLNLAKVNTNDRYQLHRMTLSIVSCIFKTCHGRAVIRNGILYKPKFEQLQLQYISFLSQIAQRPLIAYVELRKYQLNQNDDNSLYFRELTSKISQELEFSILYLQERMVSQLFRKEKFLQQEEKLTIAQIWRSINFYQYITPKIIDLIDKKQKYWDLLVEGYEDLRPLQIQQMKLCESINSIYKEIKSKIMIPEEFFDRSKDISITTVLKDLDPEDRNINILNLKIYSLLYSVILNDFDRAFQAEKQIEDLIKEDRQKSNDIIDDGALQKDDAVVVLISLVKKKGHILTSLNSRMPKILQEQFSFKKQKTLISNFLPPDLRVLHDSQLNSFISKGFTKFSVQSVHSYYVQKEGYLRECYIKLGNLFQDTEDFVLTGSILKVQQSIDVIMFDSFGKILGISQEFFETRLRRANPTLTVERLLEQGHIFLIIPYLIINLKKLASNYELDIQEYFDLAYVFEDFSELISEYSHVYQGQMKSEQLKQSTYNLTTIRSNQLSQISNRDSQKSYRSDYQEINGLPIALLGQERMIGIMEFLIKFASERVGQVEAIKVKYSIQYRTMETKNECFAYFILRMEQLSEYEQSDTLETQSFSKQLKLTLNTLKFGEQQSNMDSIFSMKQGYETKLQTKCETKYSNVMDSSQQINPLPETKYNINVPLDISVINDVAIVEEFKLIQEKVIFLNPVISEQGAEDYEFLNLVVELDQQEQEYNLNKIQKVEKLKYDSEAMEIKSNSSQIKGKRKKKNILELYQENKRNIDLHDIPEKQQKSSITSSAKTSSSKSPYLLVRTLYQIEDRNFNMWMIIILNSIICLVGFALIFIKVFIVQDQYKILQQNLNFVQYPEAINNYYLKTTMYSNNLMQQQMDLANYSEQLNSAILSEFNIISQKIEDDLKGIYEAIISFESKVIPKDDYLKIVNNLISFNYQFDLTILMEQLSSTAIILSQEFQQLQKLDEKILSMIIFLRLNMVSVIKIARSYINYLNENLLYYEDQIVNVLTYVIVSELTVIVILIIFQIRILQDMNDYLRKMLILTTKLSEEDVTLINRNLQAIKLILQDPRQVLWKTTNYVPLIFEHKQSSKLVSNAQFTYGLVAQTKDKDKKMRRRYQNSSLTSRIYNLQLPQTTTWAILFLIWLFVTAYLLGALGLAIQMISQIKPALTLNLQLIEFKLKYDALVVFAEISKTDLQVQDEWNAFPMKNITFNNLEIISELVNMMDGFQDQMGVIYDQLASSQSLLENQKTALLILFKNSLCDSMADQIPSCTQTPVDSSDGSYEYVSGGVVYAVHEFSKTLHSYWEQELTGKESYITLEELRIFLNSKTHKTQFVQHFLYQGKALENIASQMLKFNSLTLETIITQFQVYMYLAGLSMILVCFLIILFWIRRIERKLFLSKMALTLIPSNALNEQKIMQELKNIQNF